MFVLIAFVWLVCKHSDKLYGPGDFVDEDNYMKLRTAALLGAANAKTRSFATDLPIDKIVELVRAAGRAQPGPKRRWREQILWVDDHPENNTYERQAFEAIGLRVESALTTDEALVQLAHNRYAAIISDMARVEGTREGYVLLDRLRVKGDRTPLFFYTSNSLPEHQQETFEHDGQSSTDDPQDLFEMVVDAVNKVPTGQFRQ